MLGYITVPGCPLVATPASWRGEECQQWPQRQPHGALTLLAPTARPLILHPGPVYACRQGRPGISQPIKYSIISGEWQQLRLPSPGNTLSSIPCGQTLWPPEGPHPPSFRTGQHCFLHQCRPGNLTMTKSILLMPRPSFWWSRLVPTQGPARAHSYRTCSSRTSWSLLSPKTPGCSRLITPILRDPGHGGGPERQRGACPTSRRACIVALWGLALGWALPSRMQLTLPAAEDPGPGP